jgi:hypothetical protein
MKMALTNAEKQAAFRRRRSEKIKALEAEIKKLRGEPAVQANKTRGAKGRSAAAKKAWKTRRARSNDND